MVSERVDDIPVLLAHLARLGLQPLLEEHVPTHGNGVGLSLGWVSGLWVTPILSEGDHRLHHVAPWATQRRHTLQACTRPPVHPLDVSDDRWATVLEVLSDDRRWRAFEGICMKLSIDGFRTCGGFFVSTQICSQYLRGCPSDAQGLSHQPFSGVTRVGEKAAPCEFRWNERLHPTRCQGLEMAHEFEPAQLALFRAPEVSTPLWAERICEHHEKHTTI
jgi:hypothetical protein